MWKLLILVFSQLVLAQPKLSKDLPVLTVSDAFSKTKVRSESVHVKHILSQQAEVALSQARSGMFPQLELQAGLKREGSDSSASGRSESDASSFRIGLRQPLFRGFDLLGDAKLAERNFEISKFSSQDTERLLWWTVVGAYYQILALEIEHNNLVAQEEVYEKREKEIRRRTQLGRSRAADLQTTIALKLSIHAQVQRAKTSLGTAKLLLSQLTGLQVENYRLVSLKTEARPRGVVSKSRPDLKVLELTVDRSKWEVTKANSTIWPELDLAANYYPYYQNSSYPRSHGNLRWDLGLTLTWTMDWEDWTNRAGANARLNQKVQELQYQKLARESQEFLDRRYKYKEGLGLQLKDISEAVKAAEKALQLIQKDYTNGTLNLLDVVQQQNSYFEIQRQFQILEIESDLTALEIQWLQGVEL